MLPPTARGTELQVRVALAGIAVLLRRRQPPAAAAAAATAEAGTEEDGASQAAASQAAGEEDEPHIEEDEDDEEEDGEEAAAAWAAQEVETAASAVANALAGPAESHDLSARDLTNGGVRARAVRACALVRAVDVGRWVAQMPSLLSLEKSSGMSQYDKYVEAFKAVDKDNSGSISKRELYAILEKSGLSNGKQALEVFQGFDEDDDGQLDFDEFVKIAKFLC